MEREDIIVGVLGGSYTESNSGNVGTRSIVGTDDRFLVADTTARPYTAIAKLTITFPDGTVAVGTGYMVSQYTMATAGHCMYSSI